MGVFKAVKYEDILAKKYNEHLANAETKTSKEKTIHFWWIKRRKIIISVWKKQKKTRLHKAEYETYLMVTKKNFLTEKVF